MFPPTLVPSQGLDQDAGELLKIPLNDLGYKIKTGQGYDRALTFLITPLSIHNFPPGLPATVAEAWGGYGFYQNRVIEFDDNSQLYRVYSSGYRVSWEFFRSPPDSSTPYSEPWVAGCMTSIRKPADLLDAICETTFLYKDIHVQMTFAGKKIRLIEKLKCQVQNLFKTLEVTDCQSKFTTTSTTP
jgi:mRNA-degrading endonuclease HigB of HigAB toxin-antitoxin module